MWPARIVNAIVWLWVWLSDVMMPPMSPDGFWLEKARQLVRLNSNFDDPPRLIAYGMICAVMWFGIDRALRRRRERQLKQTTTAPASGHSSDRPPPTAPSRRVASRVGRD